jgi:hypothetical protein
MADFTSFQALAKILNDLTPHIEEAAVRYSLYSTVMSARVRTLTDMAGSWNTRKVSEYLRPNRATKLSEGTLIPDSTIYRARLNSVSPDEWGASYPISKRRMGTDLEDIVSEVVTTLGQSLGLRREKKLFQTANGMADSTNTYNQVANTYSMSYQIALQQEFAKRGLAGSGELFHVIHPYQAIGVKEALVDLSKAAPVKFRDELIQSWNVGGFGGLNVAESALLPRRVIYKMDFGGTTPGTFKLRIGESPTDGTELITGDITFNATEATLATNMETALNLLGVGTWDVTGADSTDMTVTPPATWFVDAEDELRVPVTSDNNGVKVYDSALTGGALSYPVISERVGSTVRSPMFFREALLLDIRDPFTYRTYMDEKYRVLQSFAYETYATSDWRPEYILFVTTKCESPFAVA